MIVVVSDVHLTDDPNDTKVVDHDFKSLLDTVTRLAAEYNPSKLSLILLGDFFDLLFSNKWIDNLQPANSRPWGIEDVQRQGKIVNDILEGIVKKYPTLKNFLGRLKEIHKDASIRYVVGNHDRLLNKPSYDFVRQRIIETFGLPDKADDKFPWYVSYDEYSVFLRHGHCHDGFNYSSCHEHSPFGDFIVWSILDFKKRLRENLYASENNPFIRAVEKAEFIEPKSKVPNYFLSIIEEYIDEPRMRTVARRVVRDTVEDFNKEAIEILLPPPGHLLREIGKNVLLEISPNISKRIRTVRPFYLEVGSILGFLSEKLLKRPQWVGKARKEDKKYKYIIFGHTHHGCKIPFGKGRYYINPGSWKPRISFTNKKDYVESPAEKKMVIVFEKDTNKEALLITM